MLDHGRGQELFVKEQPRKRRPRGPRIEEDEFEDDIDYAGRIH